ncbi:MAG: hypothetical protein F6K39_31500 [Okeania sp. SIO3B3]|nr:hypothetical protein [Okeania sp. SIO3B3]
MRANTIRPYRRRKIMPGIIAIAPSIQTNNSNPKKNSRDGRERDLTRDFSPSIIVLLGATRPYS